MYFCGGGIPIDLRPSVRFCAAEAPINSTVGVEAVICYLFVSRYEVKNIVLTESPHRTLDNQPPTKLKITVTNRYEQNRTASDRISDLTTCSSGAVRHLRCDWNWSTGIHNAPPTVLTAQSNNAWISYWRFFRPVFRGGERGVVAHNSQS